MRLDMFSNFQLGHLADRFLAYYPCKDFLVLNAPDVTFRSASLSDIESLDAEYHQSLLYMKDNDITDMGLDLVYAVDEEILGQVRKQKYKEGIFYRIGI